MLEGDKIILRPIQFEDWENTVCWRNNLFIKSSTLSHPFPITAEIEKKWYEEMLHNKDNTFLPFTAINKQNKNIIGFFTLNNINWIARSCFVSGAIGEKENIGKGFGKEAVELLIKYAFNYLNLQKVCAHVNSEHPALKTWQEIGAITEGELHKSHFVNGQYQDVLLLAWFRE